MLFAIFAFCFLRESSQLEIGVVLHLVGVVGKQFLRLSESFGNARLHRAVAIAVAAANSAVLRLHQHHGHPFRGGDAVVVVGEPREGQTLQESPHLASNLAEIVGRA